MEHIDLYPIEEAQQLTDRRKKAVRLMLVIGAIGLAICIVLCACTTMKNHRVLQWTDGS